MATKQNIIAKFERKYSFGGKSMITIEEISKNNYEICTYVSCKVYGKKQETRVYSEYDDKCMAEVAFFEMVQNYISTGSFKHKLYI